mgnify:CR=1 FL=1
MNLISNSMNKWWKLSFVACVGLTAIFWTEGFIASYGIDEVLLYWGMVPLGIWLTARWLSIKE